jgi:hypothetical protein
MLLSRAESALYFTARIENFTFLLMDGLELLNNGRPFELGCGGGGISWSLLQNLISTALSWRWLLACLGGC